MSPELIAKAIKKLNSVGLVQRLSDLFDIGEIPYSLNRKAVKLLDIDKDVYAGHDALEDMVDGLDLMIMELESFEKLSKEIGANAEKAFH